MGLSRFTTYDDHVKPGLDQNHGTCPAFCGTPRAIGLTMGRRFQQALTVGTREYVEGLEKAGLASLARAGAMRDPWLERVPDRYRLEMQGTAEGAGVAYEDLIDALIASVYPTTHCSTVLIADGNVWWLGHNNDWYDFGSHQWMGAMLREVEGRVPLLTIGFLGDTAAVAGANAEHLWLHMNGFPTSDEPDEPRALPYIFVIRDALETCTSLGDVEAMLAGGVRDGGMAVYAVDGKTGEAALFECGYQTHTRREPRPDATLASNSRDPADRVRAGEGHTIIGSNGTHKIDRLHELVVNGDTAIDMRLRAALADPVVEDHGQEFVGSSTVYSIVASPQQRQLWLAHGAAPAPSRGRWSEITWPWP